MACRTTDDFGRLLTRFEAFRAADSPWHLRIAQARAQREAVRAQRAVLREQAVLLRHQRSMLCAQLNGILASVEVVQTRANRQDAEDAKGIGSV